MGLEGVARNETMVDMSDMAVMTAPLELEDRKPGASKVDSPQVVLKEFVLPAQAGVNARQRVLENIKAEAVLWRKLRHPNIVRLLDFFAEEQRAYLVLEHIEGQSLKALVEQNQSPLDRSVTFTEIIAVRPSRTSSPEKLESLSLTMPAFLA